ncbi:MAG: glycosyl hydrolase, partial [Bacteroidota bacterium]|nr:glycosyl hydrolase [Bacteroidota bacterium]
MRKINYIFLVIFIISSLYSSSINAQKNTQGKLANKPLFTDPVFDGAADPTVIWNKNEKKWFMFYTNRRANVKNATGVTWVHGTPIGIAESSDDGATWKYRDTANINYRPDPGYTFWAPEVIENKGLYHMYLTYVPGIFADWNHPRVIVHLTSKDLLNW